MSNIGSVFKVSDVQEGKIDMSNHTFLPIKNPNILGRYVSDMEKIEHIGDNSKPIRFSTFTDNGFLAAVDCAFNNHLPLGFSPANILTCFMQLLSSMVNKNPEQYRKSIVDHDGKRKIEIYRDDFAPPGLPNNWNDTIPEFEEKIKELVNPDLDALFVKFDHSTEMERICVGGAIMSSFGSYFSYVVKTRCGIPEIKLYGSPRDWENLRVAVRKIIDLTKIDNQKWKAACYEMLDEFVNASKGNASVEWWKSFYHAKDVSGGVIINGHICAMFPISAKTGEFGWENLRRNISDFGSTIALADFIWDYRGVKIPMKFLTGLFGTETRDDRYCVPSSNFVVLRQ